MNHEGACHCGSIVVWFETAGPATEVEVRVCTCGFCRRHGARYVCDPEGWLEVRSAPGALSRYRFESGSAEFLFCNECGVYLAAVRADEDGASRGFVNVAGAGLTAFDAVPVCVSHHTADEEGAAGAARDVAGWTPASVVEAMPNA